MSKQKNLQPWLDYFRMLQTYEQKGFLEVQADKHEAYITRAALLTLLGTDETTLADQRMLTTITDFLLRIRGYAGFKSQKGEQYISANFALHMVSEDATHAPLCTILLSTKHNRLGRESNHIDVISYTEE